MTNTAPQVSTETIQQALWTPSEAKKQGGAKEQVLFVYPDRQSNQKDSSYVIVSKQYNSRFVFSVPSAELSRIKSA